MAIILDGLTGITTPGLTNTGTETIVNLTTTGNTILGDASTDTLNVGNGGLVKDASGNVGIGTASPVLKLDVSGKVKFTGVEIAVSEDYTTNLYYSGGWKYRATGYGTTIGASSGAITFNNTASSGTADAAATLSERMRITSAGNVGIGTTSPYQKLTVQGGRTGGTTTDFVSGTTGTAYSWGLGASTGNTYANFGCGINGDIVYGNAAMFQDGGYAQGMLWLGYSSSNGNYKLQVNGQIFATSSTIATSDGRYKENVNSISGALGMVCALNPVTFTWKQNVGGIENPNYDGTLKTEKWLRQPHDFGGGTQIGFIAQEVQQALENQPFINNLIKTNVRDAIKDSEGNVIHPEEEFLGIAEGNMIALLTKALQEQQALITTLTDRITALEGSTPA